MEAQRPDYRPIHRYPIASAPCRKPPEARTQILQAQIWRAHARGIENIDIEPVDTGADAGTLLGKLGETAAQEFRQKLGPILDARFGSNENDELMQDLRQLVEEHILQNPAAWDFVEVEETE